MSFVSRNFTRYLGRDPLTNDQLRQIAPSIFAETPHESRSERYSYIPTSEILDGLRAQGFDPVYAKQGGSRVPGKADFTKHLIRFRYRGEEGTAKMIGGVYPEVALLNSHDGTTKYKLMAGVMRMICLNGLLVADRQLACISVPHKGDITGQVIEGSFQVLSESRKAVEAADNWSGLKLTHDEQMSMAEAARIVRFGDADGNVDSPIKADEFLRPRRREDLSSDLWTVSNVIQENVIRGGLRGVGRDANNRRRRVTSRAVNGIDADVRLNRALWHLTESMARLKGGAAPAIIAA